LVEIETPPMSVMTLSYIAQAIVVTILGLNMGFKYVRYCMCSEYFLFARVLRFILFVFLKRETRQNSLDVWKKTLLPKKYQASQQASTEGQHPVALPHHGPNSGLA
jgi:hypothetical protein